MPTFRHAATPAVMEHAIEHTVGIYIGLLLLACVVGIAAKRITHLPYTIFLTLVVQGLTMKPLMRRLRIGQSA